MYYGHTASDERLSFVKCETLLTMHAIPLKSLQIPCLSKQLSLLYNPSLHVRTICCKIYSKSNLNLKKTLAGPCTCNLKTYKIFEHFNGCNFSP